ncbi:hypothetical protein [Mycobacterium marseillense]|uniref:Uncharacterized protein n=1 Tax=Mycobacterium marseillense TaxID=701042 RepID=A0AAC9VRX4_9MYCO|nr:hypothetical protein [Mycobacterium marseillense]ASW91276.1 hypothetical protein CKJ54_16390 [Mycobacterium marseillense]
MELGDAQAWATIIGTVIAALALTATLLISFLTARGANQRGLRDRLRQQLRAMDLACHVHFKREGWRAVNPMPQFSIQALDHVYQDGLLSPGRSHIEMLKAVLREIRNSLEATESPGDDIFRGPSPIDKARFDRALEDLGSVAEVYLRALGKMDNTGVGGYWTYLRYRFAPIRRRHRPGE